MLDSITELLNVYKYALRRAYRTNVYKYTSRRAYRTTPPSSSSRWSIACSTSATDAPFHYAVQVRFLRGSTRRFFLSLDFDDNPELIINKNLYSITRFFYYLRLSNLLRGSRRSKIQLRIIIYD
jgi:hypothetical protein